MNSISLYEEKDTFTHKISPMNKLLYIVTAILVPCVVGVEYAVVVAIIYRFILLIIGKVLKKVVPIFGISALVMITIILIQSFFKQDNKTVLFYVGSLGFYKEGLIYAVKLCLRIINIISCFSVLILTTKPSDLVEELVKRGMSPRIGYVLTSVLQIIPQMSSSMGTIMDAQRSRGMETEGKLSVRIKAFFPLISPVVMDSLISTRERTMALEIRGFTSNKKKTFLNEIEYPKYNKIFTYTLLILMIVSIVWRIIL